MLNIRRLVLLLGALLPAALGVPAAPHLESEAPANKFIVTLKPSDNIHLNSHLQWVENIHSQSSHRRSTAGVEKTYMFNEFMAYAGEFDPQTIAKIKASPDVADVTPDYIMHLADFVEEKRSLTTQNNAPWGLGTISHRLPGSNSYVYDDSAGMGTFAYVIDSGVLTTHTQFGGRASLGYNAVAGVAHNDTFGHGTHVAGIIASTSYGVAKKANIISVKVFNTGSTFVSVVLDGLTWALNDIRNKERATISVINMSLGGPASTVFDMPINAAIGFGVAIVVAGGNGDPVTGIPNPVSSQSPANVANATTVAAMDAGWVIAPFTNYGPGVDVFGPGVGILSTWIGASNTATAILSGTSMSTPHIAGLVLYLLVVENLSDSVAASARIQTLGTRNQLLGDLKGSPNIIAYNEAL